MKTPLFTVAALALATWALADTGDALAEIDAPAQIDVPAEGSVTTAAGLAAFGRIYEVVSHPRCANCHVGADNVPIWYGGANEPPAQPHGMAINAGQSRIGVETLQCSTCHRTSDDLDSVPHAPPHAGLDWRLAPVEFDWFGKSAAQICAQLSDPDRTGGRDWLGLAEHLVEDAGHQGFVLWGFVPSGGRDAAPYGLQAHVDDMLAWGVAGQPCPED